MSTIRPTLTVLTGVRFPLDAMVIAPRIIEALQSAETIPVEDLITLEDALERLDAENQRSADIVRMRFSSGLSVAETAEILGVSIRTVEGEWTHARAWFKRELSRPTAGTQ
jgi:RNA polymerase sigma factor (sigma-70 family)